MSLTASLSTPDLAQRCAEETDKFKHQQNYDPQFCYELLRRALAEQSGEAFTYVYQIYERDVMSWVRRHSRFPSTGESAEYFANAAFRSFYFALHGSRFDRFATLPALLTYLKTCVHTAIAMYLRGAARNVDVPFDTFPEQPEAENPGERIEARDLWARIQQILPDERDQLLARLTFILGFKPHDICPMYPTYWPDGRSVSIALSRIRRILRSDPEISLLVGMPARKRA